MASETKKKGPGRPRKTPQKTPPAKRGVIDTPDNPYNIVELSYDKADTIKDLSSYWKTLNVEYVVFNFVPGKLIIYTKSYREDNWIQHTVVGKKMISYYCREMVTAMVRFKDIDLVFQKMDKECTLLSITLDTNKRTRQIDIASHNNSDIPEYFKVEQVVDSAVVKQYNGVFTEDIPYPLHINMPSKWFKKTISDVKNFEDKWTISKFPGGQVHFSYNSANGHVEAKAVPPKKMIVQDDIIGPFSVTVMANVIKPTSSAMLADNLLLKASCDGRRMWMTAVMDDGAITVDILANIVGTKTSTETKSS